MADKTSGVASRLSVGDEWWRPTHVDCDIVGSLPILASEDLLHGWAPRLRMHRKAEAGGRGAERELRHGWEPAKGTFQQRMIIAGRGKGIVFRAWLGVREEANVLNVPLHWRRRNR